MTPDTTPDPVAAALEKIRERNAKAALGFSSNPGTYIDSAADIPRLLAAVEAVLELADEMAGEVARFDGIADSAGSDSVKIGALSAAQAYNRCARGFREAIMRALTGAQLGEDGNHG